MWPNLIPEREANFACKQIAVKILYMSEKAVVSECVCIKGSAFISY